MGEYFQMLSQAIMNSKTPSFVVIGPLFEALLCTITVLACQTKSLLISRINKINKVDGDVNGNLN